MNKTKLTVVLLALLLVTLVGQGSPRRRHRVKRAPQKTSAPVVAAGVWGGPHVRLQVNADGAEIEYDCAQGTLTGPLALDAAGRFSVTGTHAAEHGGPVRLGEEPSSQPARYTGSVQGQTLTLTVTLVDGQQQIGTFILTQGHESRLFKCR